MVTSLKRFQACTARVSALNPQQITTEPRLSQRLRDTYRQVCVSLLGLVLLYPGCWRIQSSVCALQESISQSYASSGSSVVRLMATSSKRAYVIPTSAAPRDPVLVADHH